MFTYKLESDLRSDFTKHINAAQCKGQPIESGTTGLGIPDEYIRTTKVGAWAEFKNMRYPIRYPFEVPFKPGQFPWLKRHWELGGISLLIIGIPEGICTFKNGNICQFYGEPLECICDFFMSSMNGHAFIAWLDTLRD